MDFASWVSAGCAVIALIGAGFGWWWSNLSRKAKRDAAAATAEVENARAHAEKDRKRAAKHLKSMQALEADMKDMADALRPPALRAEYSKSRHRLTLHNGTAEEIVITGFDNVEPLITQRIRFPIRIQARDLREFPVQVAWGTPVPDELPVQLASGQLLTVDIRRTD